MSASRLDVLLSETGLDPFDQRALEVLEEMLALVPDEAPAPSAELQAALTGRRPLDVRGGSTVSLRTCAAAALLSVSTVVGLGGLAAAANQLPDGVQRAVSIWSHRHLPFTFPRPANHAGAPAPGQSASKGPRVSVLPGQAPAGLAPTPWAGVVRSPLASPFAGSTGPSAAPSAGLLGISPSASLSGYPSLTPSDTPSALPSDTPSALPSDTPSPSPSALPSDTPSDTPSPSPSDTPSALPSDTPTESPTDSPAPSPSASDGGSPTPTDTASSGATPSDGATVSDSPSAAPAAPLAEPPPTG